MEENKEKETTWSEIEKKHAEMQSRELLASEVIAWSYKVAKAKDFAIGCLVAGIIIVGLGMSVINYVNDRDWRELFGSYDYVSQDGEGYNYYNADVEGDVVNGAESQEEEKP